MKSNNMKKSEKNNSLPVLMGIAGCFISIYIRPVFSNVIFISGNKGINNGICYLVSLFTTVLIGFIIIYLIKVSNRKN
jgi:hypothetical protein